MKGIVAKLGVKGIAALIAAAVISVSAVYYFSRPQEPQEQKPETEQMSVATNPDPSTVEGTVPATENSGVSDVTSPVNNTPADQVQEEKNISGAQDEQLRHPAALTGTTATAGGEVVNAQHSPAPSVNPSKSTGQEVTTAPTVKSTPPVPVNTNPSPVLIVSTTTGFAPLTVTAMTNQQGKNADFDFGDGSTAGNRFSTSHTYDKAGDYSLQCLVDGITLIKTIHVAGSVPTAFSPNGDGINDLFEIENGEEIQLEIRIFTRSGRQVFTGKGAKISWDGRMPDGSMAEPGTYLYDIFATPDGAPSWKQKGSLHLFN